MRYKRLLAIVVTILLFIPLFSFSSFGLLESQVYEDGYLVTPDSNINTLAPAAPLAASILTDWFNSGPYATDFRLPAGNDSVVVDVISNNGRYARRYVFPQGSWAGVYISSSSNVTFAWTTENPKDCLYMYTAYDYSSGTFDVNSYTVIYPTEAASGKYIGSVLYGAGGAVTLGGLVTNGLIEFENSSVASLGKSLAFPDGVILEEKKTQGMISQLISDIKDWFSNLIESMGNFFTELANKIGSFFTELGNKIGGFFTDLANKIGDFFTKLWNKIWWGNEAGESEYEPPDVSSKFDEVIASLNDWLSQLKGLSDSIGSQGDEVAGYLSTGSNFINTFLSVAPAPILIFLSFGVIFVVVRKVVGR